MFSRGQIKRCILDKNLGAYSWKIRMVLWCRRNGNARQTVLRCAMYYFLSYNSYLLKRRCPPRLVAATTSGLRFSVTVQLTFSGFVERYTSAPSTRRTLPRTSVLDSSQDEKRFRPSYSSTTPLLSQSRWNFQCFRCGQTGHRRADCQL